MELEPTPAERCLTWGLDPSGLSVRAFHPDDFDMVYGWWACRRSEPFHFEVLPPLGVIVLDEHQRPMAVIWCYETFGSPVAFLEFPITRPGLSLKAAQAAVGYAIASCMEMAGQWCEPRATYVIFRAMANNASLKTLRRFGFTQGEALTSMTFVK